jgi:hypothetical protein
VLWLVFRVRLPAFGLFEGSQDFCYRAVESLLWLTIFHYPLVILHAYAHHTIFLFCHSVRYICSGLYIIFFLPHGPTNRCAEGFGYRSGRHGEKNGAIARAQKIVTVATVRIAGIKNTAMMAFCVEMVLSSRMPITS